MACSRHAFVSKRVCSCDRMSHAASGSTVARQLPVVPATRNAPHGTEASSKTPAMLLLVHSAVITTVGDNPLPSKPRRPSSANSPALPRPPLPPACQPIETTIQTETPVTCCSAPNSTAAALPPPPTPPPAQR